MTGPVFADDKSGRAVIFDCVTGQVLTVSVPTAIENVRLGAGRYVHGTTGDVVDAPVADPAPAPDPVIPLTEPDVLPLPEGEKGINDSAPADELAAHRTVPGGSAEKLEAIEREVDEANAEAAEAADPLDHDGDGKKGGAKAADRSPEEEAERAEIIAQLRAKGVRFFAGSATEKLKEKLASS